MSGEEYLRRVALLRENMRAKAVVYNWHDAETSFVEAVLSRGTAAWRRCWRPYGTGEAALKPGPRASTGAAGTRPLRSWGRPGRLCVPGAGPDEFLPWDRIDMGIGREYLWRERERAYTYELTPDCREKCAGCGASNLLEGGGCACG